MKVIAMYAAYIIITQSGWIACKDKTFALKIRSFLLRLLTLLLLMQTFLAISQKRVSKKNSGVD